MRFHLIGGEPEDSHYGESRLNGTKCQRLLCYTARKLCRGWESIFGFPSSQSPSVLHLLALGALLTNPAIWRLEGVRALGDFGNGQLDTAEEEESGPGLWKSVEGHIQGKTLAGLIALVPLIVTVVVLVVIIGYADSAVRRLPFVKGEPWDFWGVGMIVAVVLFYVVGLIISTRIGRIAMDFKDTVFNHIPVVKTILGVTKQAMASLTSQYQFSRVVFIEWPREGMVAMGFVTGQAFSRKTKDSIVVVYIPTVPNPTSGNMALVPEDDIIETAITVEDAMKLVFSGGIVLPEAFSLARMPVEREDFGLIGRFETAPD